MNRHARPRTLAVLAVLALIVGVPPLAEGQKAEPTERKVIKTDAEWRKQLTPAQYHVTREKGTEPAFSGKYATGHFKGVFACAGCDAEVFSSNHKFNSG